MIKHKDFNTRALFDEEMDKVLRSADVEIICLAGFMRILSGMFHLCMNYYYIFIVFLLDILHNNVIMTFLSRRTSG